MATTSIFFQYLIVPLFLMSITLSSQIIFSEAQSSSHHDHVSRPVALLFPVLKDNSTRLHVASFQKRTPRRSIPFLIDLNSKFLWVRCEKSYLSSSYNAPHCHSIQCMHAGAKRCHRCFSPERPGCHNNTCAIPIRNPLTRKTTIGELAQDLISIQSVNQSIPGSSTTIPRFLFACAPSAALRGLPRHVQGVAALGHSHTALPMQFASNFGFPPVFALCLSSAVNRLGVAFFGNTSYGLHPGIDFSRNLFYTPLTIGSQGEYLISVSSIMIHNKPVPINKSLVSRATSFTNAMISTTTPYTILESSLFREVTDLFTGEMLRASPRTNQVQAVPPFSACFSNLTIVPRTEVWAPIIHLHLHNDSVVWSMLSTNSLVEVQKGVSCLAFVDGGPSSENPKTAPIIIGAHQLEDNVVQFDLEQSKFGFRYALRFSRHSCAGFEFNPAPQPPPAVKVLY